MTATAVPDPSSSSGAGATARAAASLVEAFLSGKSPRTCLAYRQDLEDFRRFASASNLDAAALAIVGVGQGEANALALAYRAHLLRCGFAPATVNRRLATLRSLVKLARTLGRIPWMLEVDSVRAQTYRDTRGPGREGYLRMLANLDGSRDHHDLRARAILRLLYDLGLRRGEVVALDTGDVDLERGTIRVLGKGRTQKETLTLPGPTCEALREWLEGYGCPGGPLFINFDASRPREKLRLSGTSVYRIVRDLGERVGLRVRPHGLRHAAITEALNLTRGDVRAVQRFSRHRKLETLLRYDDNRADLAGAIARRVAEAAEPTSSTPWGGVPRAGEWLN